MAGGNAPVRLGIQGEFDLTQKNAANTAQQLEATTKGLRGIVTTATEAEKVVPRLDASLKNLGKAAVTGIDEAEKQAKRIAQLLGDTNRALAKGSYFPLQSNSLLAEAQTQSKAVEQMGNNMTKHQTAVKGFADAVTGAFIASGETAKDYLKAVQSSMAARLAGVWAAMRYAKQAGEAMRELDLTRASMYRITGDQLSTAYAMEMASTIAGQYSVKIQDVAKAMTELARQGRSMSDVVTLTTNLAEIRLLLATSTGKLMGMPDMIQHVTTLMNQMNVTAHEAVQGLRLMAQLDIETAASFDRIGQALTKFAATGKMARMTMDEIIFAASAFAEAGFTGEQAGTALNTILSRVGRNVETLAFMKQFGVGLTTMKDGVAVVNNSMNMLIETYKKLKSEGSFMEMREFLNMFAGTRMQSKLIAGIEQYIRQEDSGRYDAIKERGLSQDERILMQRQDAIASMLDTIESKRVEVANAFNSIFVKPEFLNIYKSFLDQMMAIGANFAKGVTDAARGVLSIAGLGEAEQGLENLAGLFRAYLVVKIPTTILTGIKYIISTLAVQATEVAAALDRMIPSRGISFEDTMKKGQSGIGLVNQSKNIVNSISAITTAMVDLEMSFSKFKPGTSMVGLASFWDSFKKTFDTQQLNTKLTMPQLSPEALLPDNFNLDQARVGKAAIDSLYNNLVSSVQQRSAQLQDAVKDFMRIDPVLGTKLSAELTKLQQSALDSLTNAKNFKIRSSGAGAKQLLKLYTDEFETVFQQLQGKLQLSVPPIESGDLIQSIKRMSSNIKSQISGLSGAFADIIPAETKFSTQLQGIEKAYDNLQDRMLKTMETTGQLTEKQYLEFHGRLQKIASAHERALQTATAQAPAAIINRWGPQVEQQLTTMQGQVKAFYDILAQPKIAKSEYAKTFTPMVDGLQVMIKNAEAARLKIVTMAADGKVNVVDMGRAVNGLNDTLIATQAQVAKVGTVLNKVDRSWSLIIARWSASMLNYVSMVGMAITVAYTLKRAWDFITGAIVNATTELKAYKKIQEDMAKQGAIISDEIPKVEAERDTMTGSRTGMYESFIQGSKRMMEMGTDAADAVFADFQKNAKNLVDATMLIESKFRVSAEDFEKQKQAFASRTGKSAEEIEKFITALISLPKGAFENTVQAQQTMQEFFATFLDMPTSAVAEFMSSSDSRLKSAYEAFTADFVQLFETFRGQLPQVQDSRAITESANRAASERALPIVNKLMDIIPDDTKNLEQLLTPFKKLGQALETRDQLLMFLVDLAGETGARGGSMMDTEDIMALYEAAKLAGGKAQYADLKPLAAIIAQATEQFDPKTSSKTITDAIVLNFTDVAVALKEGNLEKVSDIVKTFSSGMQVVVLKLVDELFGADIFKEAMLSPFLLSITGKKEATESDIAAVVWQLFSQAANAQKQTKDFEAKSATMSGLDSTMNASELMREFLADYSEQIRNLNEDAQVAFMQQQLEAGKGFEEKYKPDPKLLTSWLDLISKIDAKITELTAIPELSRTTDDKDNLTELNKLKGQAVNEAKAIYTALRPEKSRRDPARDMLHMVKDDYEAAKAAIEAQYQFREDASGKIIDLQDRTKTPEIFREHIANIEVYIAELEKISKKGDAAFQSRVGKELQRAILERKKTIFNLEQARLEIVSDAALIRIDLLNRKLQDTKGILDEASRLKLADDLISENLQITANQLAVAGGGSQAYTAVSQMMDRLNEAEKSANLTAQERVNIYGTMETRLISLLEGLGSITEEQLDPKLIRTLQDLLRLVKEIKTETQEGIFAESKMAIEMAMTIATARDSYDNISMTREFDRTLSGQSKILEKRLQGIQQDQSKLLTQIVSALKLGPETDPKTAFEATGLMVDVIMQGLSREMETLKVASGAGTGALMSSGQIQEYANTIMDPKYIEQMTQKAMNEALNAMRDVGVSEEILGSLDLRALVDAIKRIIINGSQQVIENLVTAQQELMEAVKAGWEEGFNIGFDQGFTDEGYASMKDAIIRKIGQFASQTIAKLVSESISDALAEAFSGLGEIGGALGGMVGSILGTLVGFLIGGLFNKLRDQAAAMVEEQRRSQKDRVTSSGFDWSYRESEKATPYYEFSPPVTQESVKIVKFVNNFSITTDAAMAMIGQQRELERVVQEIVSNMNRTLAKTVGVVI